MKQHDTLQRLLFDKPAVRGELVSLDRTWQTVLDRRDYPPVVRDILGEAMAACALLSATIKYDGLLTLQLQAKGPLNLLVVQATSDGTLRGLARWQDPIESGPLAEICGDGTLVITIDPGQGKDQYQGVVDLVGHTLADALEQYFERSEQLATRLLLAAGPETAAGMLLQRLPQQAVDDDGWNRLTLLGDTLSREELLGLDGADIIHRLFHEEDVRLLSDQSFRFECTCSRQRIANLLISLGEPEVSDIVKQQGEVAVACEFCGLEYRFDAVDARELFSGGTHPDVPDTRH